MIKAWSEQAWESFGTWHSERRKLQRVWMLLKSIERDGINQGYGKPESLRGDLSGYWSRRIDDADRLVYSVEGNMIKIMQCGTHYGDK